MSAAPFTVRVPQATLDDPRARRARTRWPGAVDEAGWDYGTDPEYLRELVGYWQTAFDWRAQEAAMNRSAHFRCC